jgi:hypothetical protein
MPRPPWCRSAIAKLLHGDLSPLDSPRLVVRNIDTLPYGVVTPSNGSRTNIKQPYKYKVAVSATSGESSWRSINSSYWVLSLLG